MSSREFDCNIFGIVFFNWHQLAREILVQWMYGLGVSIKYVTKSTLPVACIPPAQKMTAFILWFQPQHYGNSAAATWPVPLSLGRTCCVSYEVYRKLYIGRLDVFFANNVISSLLSLLIVARVECR